MRVEGRREQVADAADVEIMFGTYICTAFGRFTRCCHVHSVGIGGGVVTVSSYSLKVCFHYLTTDYHGRSVQTSLAE